MTAFDNLVSDKKLLNTVIDARNRARDNWLLLENEYNKSKPKVDLASKIGNKFSEMRDIAKQKRTQSVEK